MPTAAIALTQRFPYYRTTFAEFPSGSIDGRNGWEVIRSTWKVQNGLLILDDPGNTVAYGMCYYTGIGTHLSMAVEMEYLYPAGTTVSFMQYGPMTRIVDRPGVGEGQSGLGYHGKSADWGFRGWTDTGFNTSVRTNPPACVTYANDTWVRTRTVHRAKQELEGTPNADRLSLIQNGTTQVVTQYNFAWGTAGTEAGYPGITSWGEHFPGLGGGPVRCRQFAVYGPSIVVQGLSGTQGFRVYDSAGAVLQSSATQSGGQAFVHISDVIGSPFTGYLQVFNDAGTWASPITTKRYPIDGTAELRGGDVFATPNRASYIIEVNWDGGTAWPWWTQAYARVGDNVCVEDIRIRRQVARPRIEVDTATFTLADDTLLYVPGYTGSALYPHVREDRAVRIFAEQDNLKIPLFYGALSRFIPEYRTDPPFMLTIEAESPLRALAAVEIELPLFDDAYVFKQGETTSVLRAILELAADADGGYEIPDGNRAIESSDDKVSEFGGGKISVGSALEELACRVNAMFWIEPLHRTTAGGIDYLFRWMPLSVAVAQGALFALDNQAGDLDDTPRVVLARRV